MSHQSLKKLNVRLGSDDFALGQGLAQALQCGRTIGIPDDELGDHRVVVNRDAIALNHTAVNTDMTARRGQTQHVQGARGRQEVRGRIFGVQAHFDGMPRLLGRNWRQRLAGGNTELPFDQVLAQHHFGDRMLYLQACVDLHEIEPAIGTDNKLDCAGVDVVDGLAGHHGRFAHGLAQGRGQERRGRLFEHFLIATLRTAFAFKQMHDIAMRVAENLNLDMARRFNKSFQQDAVAAKRIERFATATLQRGGKLSGRADNTHTFATTAVGRLNHQRITDGIGLRLQELRILIGTGVTGHDRHAGGLHQILSAGFGAHLAHRFGARTDERQTGLLHGLGKVGVLRQKAIARVNRLRAATQCDIQNYIATQIRLGRRITANRIGFVGLQHMLRHGVGCGVHRHRSNAQTLSGANDAAGDFAAIGDQNLGQHQKDIQVGLRFSRKAVKPS